jgi:hypothetical protein
VFRILLVRCGSWAAAIFRNVTRALRIREDVVPSQDERCAETLPKSIEWSGFLSVPDSSMVN